MYIDVLLELKNKQMDQTYTYSVPKNLQKEIEIGKRVKVPFNHRELEGFILNKKETIQEEFKVLEILSIVDQEIVLNEELIKIGKFIKETYLCSLSSAYATMLPKALKASLKTNIPKKYQSNLILALPYQSAIELCKNNLQKEIIDLIFENEKLSKKEANLISSSSVKTLLNKKIIEEEQEEVYRLQSTGILEDEKKFLNEEQQKAKDTILKSLNKNEQFLLYGVTGSGKTEVYMQVIDEVMKQKKTAIVLVPEISLTPQFVANFKSSFKICNKLRS